VLADESFLAMIDQVATYLSLLMSRSLLWLTKLPPISYTFKQVLSISLFLSLFLNE
jgi:hypothetical protein